MNQCNLVELMLALDKRLSVKSFTAGIAANVASQAAMYGKSALWSTVNDLSAAYKDTSLNQNDKYQKLGTILFKYVATLFNFTASSASVKTKTN